MSEAKMYETVTVGNSKLIGEVIMGVKVSN